MIASDILAQVCFLGLMSWFAYWLLNRGSKTLQNLEEVPINQSSSTKMLQNLEEVPIKQKYLRPTAPDHR